jgi:hypothetical protein
VQHELEQRLERWNEQQQLQRLGERPRVKLPESLPDVGRQLQIGSLAVLGPVLLAHRRAALVHRVFELRFDEGRRVPPE